jgi:hypothetical protein
MSHKLQPDPNLSTISILQALRKIYEFGPIPKLRKEAPLLSGDKDQIHSLVADAEAELRRCEAELVKARMTVDSLELEGARRSYCHYQVSPFTDPQTSGRCSY